MIKNEYLAPIAISIGDTVIELLSDNKMNVYDLSDQTGYSVESLVSILMGETEVTQDFANKLATVFAPSADFWLKLDRKYRETLKRLTVV